jgi:hypothetical protein
MIIRPTQRADMDAAHARARATKKIKTAESTRPWNVDVVLDLGNAVFFHFRGRAYGVPPLPWRQGQRMLSLYTAGLQYKSPLSPDDAPKYFRIINQLAKLLWKNCYPTSLPLRVLRWFGLMPNPFRLATEQEIAEHTNFFLARRMRSGVFNQ